MVDPPKPPLRKITRWSMCRWRMTMSVPVIPLSSPMKMILSDTEFESITCGTHASPHDLLGMHRLADGGVVVRAFLPLAKAVVAVPTDQVNKPVIPLRRVGDSDCLKAWRKRRQNCSRTISRLLGEAGEQWRTRDPFSFLPTISEDDLFLFGRGDERRIYESWAHPRTIDGVTGTSFAVWAPNAKRVSVGRFQRLGCSASSHAGSGAVWRMGAICSGLWSWKPL